MNLTSKSSDPRNSQVSIIVQNSKSAFSDNLGSNAYFWRTYDDKDAKFYAQMNAEIIADQSGYSLCAGYINGDKNFPVAISISFWRRIRNVTDSQTYVPLLATYEFCGKWADFDMAEEFVKKLFINHTIHYDDDHAQAAAVQFFNLHTLSI